MITAGLIGVVLFFLLGFSGGVWFVATFESRLYKWAGKVVDAHEADDDGGSAPAGGDAAGAAARYADGLLAWGGGGNAVHRGLN